MRRSGGSLPTRLATAFYLAALALLSPLRVQAFSYPALDTTSHWSIQDWGFAAGQGFYVQGAEKRVWLGAGQPESKAAFYNLSVAGVRLNGVQYPLLGQDFMGEMEGDGYLTKYGSFKVTQDVSLVVVLFFVDDGKFEANAYFTGAGYSGSQPWDIVIRIDYDMAGASNNIAEFLWNDASEGRSISPPQVPRSEAADGRLVYSPSKRPASGYWSTTAHEISVAYPALPREAGPGIENAGFARILNAGNPQFGMVLWGDAVTPVEATFKAYTGFDGNLSPRADITTPLQFTGESGKAPRYAFGGRDQMVFLDLGAPPGGGTYKFGGKLFQRGNGRPLAVTVHQHHPDYLGGFGFDPDAVLRYTGAGARTFRNAMGELAGASDLTVVRSGENGIGYLPFDGYASPGQAVTEAQLHNLMTATRDYSPGSMENVRDWRMDLYVVDWTLQGEPGVWEAMFDFGTADANGISREGAAVFWPALAGRGTDFQRRQAGSSALHSAGLALNMDPSWGACSFAGYCWKDASGCGGKRCGAVCPPGAQGCAYQAFNCVQECREGSVMSLTDVDHNSVGFNRGASPGSGFSEFDWYRKAPEAWVKPGRFGVPPISGPMPPFTPN
ncbi:MAG: hypothetical protein JWP91_88 [Fibrobacteres bacterium]|nr:hypothetical protein [Fibrobacterota bacterium]